MAKIYMKRILSFRSDVLGKFVGFLQSLMGTNQHLD